MTARMIKAPRIPQNSTLCWKAGATAKYEKVIAKIKTLSMLRLFSIRYPVKNSSARWSPRSAIVAPAGSMPAAMERCSISAGKKKAGFCQIQRLKPSAHATQTSVHIIASLKATSCALRWNTPRSSASINTTNALNPNHNHPEVISSPLEDRRCRNAMLCPSNYQIRGWQARLRGGWKFFRRNPGSQPFRAPTSGRGARPVAAVSRRQGRQRGACLLPALVVAVGCTN